MEKVIYEEEVIIFVAYITLRNGKRLYAKSVGKKAFPIRVKRAV